MQRWQQDLINHNSKAIYFNAWEDDFHTNPLVAIIGQLWKELKKDDWKEIINSLKESIPAIVSKKCFDFLGLDKKDLQSTAEQTVDEYLETRTKIDELKARLKMLAATVKGQTGMPLVFIVDELDRCRPTFAIELLERIKHVLGVPNIVFVFGINKTQLEESIKLVYGNIKAEDYLRKFFDINLNLPHGKPSVYCEHLLKKYEIMIKIHRSSVHQSQYGDIGPRFNGTWDRAITEIPIMVEYMNLSLRDIEQLFRMIFAILTNKEIMKEKRMYKYEGWRVIYLMFLRIKNFALYQDFIQNKCKSKDVINDMLKHFPDDKSLSNFTDILFCKNNIEIVFYTFANQEAIEAIKIELELITEKSTKKHMYVSERIQQSIENAGYVLGVMNHEYKPHYHHHSSPQKIAELMEWGIH